MGFAAPLRKPLLTIAMAALLPATAVSITACSGGSEAPSSASSAVSAADAAVDAGPPWSAPVCADAGLTVAFSPMYSAYDGTHTFQVPALVVGSNGTVTWSADPSLVGMQADSERPNEVLITMLKAGVTTIAVQSSDGKCGSAQLNISAATEADWKIGNARYNNGTSLHLSGPATGGTGSPLEMGSGGPACTGCHGETATGGPYTDVSHTPEQTGGFSDSDLLGIILRGNFPDGGYFDPSIALYPAWHNFHRWVDITTDQQRGIITYLRSLTPAPQKGAVNFGAFMMDAGTSGGVTDDGGDAGAGDMDATSGGDSTTGSSDAGASG